MRVKVIRAFVDKETGQGYNDGDHYETYETPDASRASELHEAGFLSKPPSMKAPAKKAPTRKAASK